MQVLVVALPSLDGYLLFWLFQALCGCATLPQATAFFLCI
jgi:hypothetical protein